MFLRKVLIAALCCFFVFCGRAFSQGSSNKGTDFWLGYGNHISVTTQQMAVYITSDVNTTATMTIGSSVTSYPIVKNQITTVPIPQSAYLGTTVGKITNKGIHITSLKPIVMYAHIFNGSISGATLVLPTNTLGKEYFSINYEQMSNAADSYSYCFVVAIEDNTQIVVTPSATVQGSVLVKGQQSAPITLMKGEIYQILGVNTVNAPTTQTHGTDLTGSLIKSVTTTSEPCKKIAVFSGSGKISIGCVANAAAAAGSADNLFQQVYPTATWGQKFYTVPLKSRNYDIFRIFKSDPAAVVKLNGVVIPAASFVNGQYYDFPSQIPNYIESDKPIQAVQYAVTQGKNIASCTATTAGDVGDPEMIYLNPLEQTLTTITMYSCPNAAILSHFVNVVIKTSDTGSFILDGANQSAKFVAASNLPGYSYAQLSVSAGTHNMSASGGFNATAYGFGGTESYGYAAGANLVSRGLKAQTHNTTVVKNTGCVNEPYDFDVTLSYLPSKLTLDMGDGNPSFQVPVTSYQSSYVENGITQYVYALTQNTLFNTAKTYTIKLLAEKPTADGCGSTDELVLDYVVNTVPSASFTSNISQTCVNQPVTLTSTSTDNGNTIVKWYWNFGDNTPPEIRTDATAFTHSYASSGDYTVTLMVEGTSGCQSPVASQILHIYKTPEAKFSYQTITCKDSPIAFTDGSIANEGIVSKYTWDFADPNATTSNPNASSVKNPTHIYTKAGTYKVTLTVETDKGCISAVFSKDVIIYELPVVDFETPDFCLSDGAAPFTNKTTIADGTGSQLTYLWNFGDPNANAARPNTSTAANPSHAYTVAGYYDVALTVTSANGCTIGPIIKKFTVNGSTPKAAFNIQNPNSLCSNQPVKFEDLGTVDFGEITRIDWYYDYDNNPTVKETDDTPQMRSGAPRIYSHQYPAFSSPFTRTYKVRMVAFSGSGSSNSCVATAEKTITLKAVPATGFNLPSTCVVDGKAQFINTTTIAPGGEPLIYAWNFGDMINVASANTAADKDPVHVFKAAGSYTITLTATSANGCSETSTKAFVISAAVPKPEFNVVNPTALCSDQPVIFEDKATIPFGEITRIEWCFDADNQSANPAYIKTDNTPNLRSGSVKQYSFQYPVFHSPYTKIVNVRMRAFSGQTCVAEIIKPIVLKAVPDLVFNPLTNICLEKDPVQFTEASELSSLPGSGVYSGTGVSATGLFNPAVAKVGTHIITYTFTATNGCTAIKTQPITVYQTPSLDLGADQFMLLGGQVRLVPKITGNIQSYKWSPATGLDHDNVESPVANPDEDITYTLTVTTTQGCSTTDEVFVKVLKGPVVPNTFTPNGDGVNDTWDIKYLESYPGATIDIFNRYGAKIFHAVGYGVPWDGRRNGTDLETGNYYYIINPKNGRSTITGSVMIVR